MNLNKTATVINIVSGIAVIASCVFGIAGSVWYGRKLHALVDFTE